MKIGLTDYELQEIFSPLEAFTGPFDEELRQAYYETYRNTPAFILRPAIRLVIRRMKSHKPPLLSEIDDVINEVAAEYNHEVEFCQQCQNTGFYLGDDEIAHFCTCVNGKRKEAIFKLGTYDEKKIAKYVRDNPPGPPKIGIYEFNQELKIWELNKEEHEKWMEKARERLDALKAKSRDISELESSEASSIGHLAKSVVSAIETLIENRKEIDEGEIPF